MTGWGNEWPVIFVDNNLEMPKKPWPEWPVYVPLKEMEQAAISQSKVYNNIMPTHDPYTNPNAIIYYECLCGAILDPGTKSFASLNNHASEKGWKIRFSDKGYIPYCMKCGEEIE